MIVHVPEADYFGPEWASRISASDLKTFSSSRLEYYGRKIARTLAPKSSTALREGKLTHSWHEFGEDRYWDILEICPKEFETATGALSKKGEAWLASITGDKIGITSGEREKVWNQTRGILANPAAVRLMQERVDCEFCIQWMVRGTPMRARIDGATEQYFYDLKTTSDDDVLGTFWSSVRKWKYDLQSAVYGSAAEACDWEPHSMRFIVTQSKPPYHCHVVWLPDAVIRRARDRMLRLLDEIRECTEWDHWLPPDYGHETELYCPPFMHGESNDGW